MLFTAAKITHLGLLSQGQPERYSRVVGMVAQHDDEGFGGAPISANAPRFARSKFPLRRSLGSTEI